MSVVATLSLATAAVACGDDGSSDDAGSAAPPEAPADTTGPNVGGDPAVGEQLARSNGCAGCHGQDFGGGAGPSLIGLAGAEVPLDDGTVVVADYNLKMPANNLSDAEIADIVAYIETLTDG